jgi:zinc transport system ATP-binding protein
MELDHSLEVYAGEEPVFCSDRHWVYPLLDLERFLAEHGRPDGELEARDKVVGKAAAMIMVHLGITRVVAVLMSELARGFLDDRSIPFTYEQLVPRIMCRTEEILADVDDPADAYRIIERRAAGAT